MIEREGQRDVIMLGLELDSRGGENDGRVSPVHKEKGRARTKSGEAILHALHTLLTFSCLLYGDGELSRFCFASPYVIYSLLLITYFCFGSD